MSLPYLVPVLIDDGRYRTALLTSDSFEPFVGILLCQEAGGPDPLAVAEEIAKRCNEYKP